MELLDLLDEMFPNARCELDFKNAYELTIAVLLSQQATDKSVNKVTKELFAKYPDAKTLSFAEIEDVEAIIKPVGLYHSKANNLVNLAICLVNDYNETVPNNREALEKLPGIGRKSTNVILSEVYNIPEIAVDTHLTRVSKRLGLVKKNDDVRIIEKKLCQIIPQDSWVKFHHQMIFLGRYVCKAKNPLCKQCKMNKICQGKEH